MLGSTGSTNISNFPSELLLEIFVWAKDSLQDGSLRSVCKEWNEATKRDGLHQMVYKSILDCKVIAPEDYETISGFNAEKTNFLPPRWWLVSEKIADISWIPESVKRIINKKDGGQEEQCLQLETAEEVMEELLANQKQGNETVYDPRSWPDALKAKWEVEKGHWVCFESKFVDKNLHYSVQERDAQAKGPGADVSERRDSIISLSMQKAKYGKRSVVYDPANGQTTYIRFKDKMKDSNGDEWRMMGSFAPSRLSVFFYYDYAFSHVAVAVARKFFGPRTLGL